MTVVVAVRTGSAAILAADSKLTTQSFVGLDKEGNEQYAPQTYDSAFKIAADASQSAIAAFAGYANIGEQNAVDYFSRLYAELNLAPTDQDSRVQEIASNMVETRRIFCQTANLPFSQAAKTTVILSAPPAAGTAPRFWKIDLAGEGVSVIEILRNASVWVEGSVNSVLTLLYGLEDTRAEALRVRLGIDVSAFQEQVGATVDHALVRRINFWTMPIQDAMDFAVFCANVQIEMDRFLPGFGSCGGPVDLMTLEMAPEPTIRSFPGKKLHHPGER